MPPLSSYDDMSCLSSSWSSSSSATMVTVKSILKQSEQQQVQQPAAPQKRNVHFCKKVKVQPTLHVNNFTDKEIRSSWYTQNEIATIRQRTKDMMKLLQSQSNANTPQKVLERQQQGSNDESTFCIRGLEHRTRKGMKAKTSSRMMAWDVVMNEQSRQQESGVVNPEAISHVYKQTTTVNVAIALQRGLDDEDYVFAAIASSSRKTKNAKPATRVTSTRTQTTSSTVVRCR